MLPGMSHVGLYWVHDSCCEWMSVINGLASGTLWFEAGRGRTSSFKTHCSTPGWCRESGAVPV